MIFYYDRGKLNFAIDLFASLTTLAGIALGSTTVAGACMYLVSNAFWWALTVRRRMWALVPLNVGVLLVTIANLRAVS